MASRTSPGVYVEIVDSGIKPISATGTSTAGFIGPASRGVPGVATFVRGFPDFERAFGGHRRGSDGHLAQAVEAFFAAGGSRGFVVRVLPDDAQVATSEPLFAREDDAWGADRPVLRVDARGAGAWAENLRVHVRDSAAFPDRAFLLEVEWVEGGRGRVVERFDDVVLDPESPDYVVEAVAGRSRYVRVTDLYRAALDADPRTALPGPDRGPLLRTLDTDAFEVPLNGAITLRWSGPDGAGGDATITFSEQAATDAGGAVGEGGTTVELTRAQLGAVITAQADGELVVAADGTTIGAPVATTAYLVAPSEDGSTSVDLTATDGLTIRITDGDGGNAQEATLDTGATGVQPLADLATALTGALSDADLDELVEVTAAGSALVVRSVGAPAAGTVLALDVDGGAPFGAVQTRDGSAGTVVDDLSLVTLVASEKLEPGRARTLPAVLASVRASGLLESSALDPGLRPAGTGEQPLRLRGGTDGKNQVTPLDFAGREDANGRTGLKAFDDVDIQLLVIPGRNDADVLSIGMSYADRREVFYIADGLGSDDHQFAVETSDVVRFVEGLPARSDNAAMFYPWIEVSDPVGVGRAPRRFVPPSGHVAGVFARTDRTRGVWKAPAGLEAGIPGALDLQHRLLDADQDLLNPIGLSCLRQRPGAGIVSWGARTLSSDPEWRYTSVRRTALFLVDSLRRGLQWVVFEPNDVELWGRIRSNVEAFMLSLFRQGAFQGATPDQAFAVKCDAETNPQELIDLGIVSTLVAFAPLKPAEFVVVQLSQKTLLAT